MRISKLAKDTSQSYSQHGTKTFSFVQVRGVTGALTIDKDDPVEVKVGSTALPNRRIIWLYHNTSGAVVCVSFSAQVTTTGDTAGIPLKYGELTPFEIGNVKFYIVSDTNNTDIRVAEAF